MRKKILELLIPKPNVPTTKKEKALSKLKILQQKTNASKAKLSQTQFELKNNKPLTFKSNKGLLFITPNEVITGLSNG